MGGHRIEEVKEKVWMIKVGPFPSHYERTVWE